MKQLAYLGAIAFAGFSVCALPAISVLSGEYRPDCAPYDGAAFIVVLRAPSSKGELLLKANAPLQEAPGKWRHSGLSQPNDAAILFCPTGPERKCDYAESGSFQIEPLSAGKMSGSLEAHFSRGVTYQFNFVAKPARGAGKPVMCR